MNFKFWKKKGPSPAEIEEAEAKRRAAKQIEEEAVATRLYAEMMATPEIAAASHDQRREMMRRMMLMGMAGMGVTLRLMLKSVEAENAELDAAEAKAA